MGSSPLPLFTTSKRRFGLLPPKEDSVKGRLVAFKVKSVGSIPASSGGLTPGKLYPP